jgi:hypothetical protein
MNKKTIIGLTLIVAGYGFYYYYKKKQDAAAKAAAAKATNMNYVGVDASEVIPVEVVTKRRAFPIGAQFREEFRLVVPPKKANIPAIVVGEELRQRAYYVDPAKIKAPLYL